MITFVNAFGKNGIKGHKYGMFIGFREAMYENNKNNPINNPCSAKSAVAASNI